MAVLTPDADPAATALEGVVAAEYGRVLAAVIRSIGDWAVAEDAVQDAFARAVEAWPRDGVPRSPAAWLTTTARNRAIDILRRERTRRDTTQRLGVEVERGWLSPSDSRDADALLYEDDRLRLIYTCCHPALALDACVALTLRTVLGMTAAEIARSFLTTEVAMEKRLVRARAKIAHAGIPYRVPPAELLPERTAGVLAVLYLLFTQGYAAAAGEHILRRPLSAEAIRLTRLVRELTDAAAPERIEIDGLLALMLAQSARDDARTDADGIPIRLPDQDRTRWDRTAMAEAERLIAAASARAAHERVPAGPYLVQAAIAVEHLRAVTPDATDHARIADLYRVLARIAPSPVVELNRAVAEANSHGPDAGLAVLDGIGDALDGHHLFHAARADLLERAGHCAEAREEFVRAAELAPTDAERTALRERIR